MRYYLVLFLTALILFQLPARAQKEFNTWCFGDGTALNSAATTIATKIKVRFTDAGPLPADTCGGLYSLAGGIGNATISDPAGNLILYTDGLTVNNRRHRLMANGILDAPRGFVDITFERMVQSTAAVTGPDRLHYIFYWTLFRENGVTSYNLTYAVVDDRLQNGDGAVVSKGHVLARTLKARVTVVRHQNNLDFWVITRDLDTRGFQAYLLTRRGVDPTPVGSLVGQAATPTGCELKAAPDGRRLVCSGTLSQPGNTSAEFVCVYDFDNATGVVSREQAVRRLPFLAAGPRLRTASFSPNSHLLYTVEPNPDLPSVLPRHYRASDIWQYDLRRNTPPEVEQSRFKVSDVPLPPGLDDSAGGDGLQLTPDGTLWAALFYFRQLFDPVTNRYIARLSAATIQRPDVVGAGCGFAAEGYPYQVDQIPSIALPNLITNMLYAPATLNLEVGCAEDSVRFWASSAGASASLRWNFGDPTGAANSATGAQVAHRYAHGGTYTVRLTLANGRVLEQSVAIAASTIDFTGANIFTPNADGYNDEFVPVQAPLPQGQIRVFSRWGQLVYESTAKDLRWDGTGAAPGEYYYYLTYSDCLNRIQRRQGIVTLVR